MAALAPSRFLPVRWLTEARDALASILIPARLMRRIVDPSSRIPICEACLDSFPQVPEKICVHCGIPLPDAVAVSGEALRCAWCRVGKYGFDRARSFALYENEVVRPVLLLNSSALAACEVVCVAACGNCLGEWRTLAADVVVPVPLHRDREKERGYNQAELLSKPLAKFLGLPHRGVLPVRKRPRPTKHVLAMRERWAAVRGAFETCPGSQVDNLRVLLLDDGVTTGATLDACSKALRDAGAKSVVALTVARAAHYPLPAAGER